MAKFIGSPGQHDITEAGLNPEGPQSDGIRTGRTGIDHGLTGPGQIKFPGQDVHRITAEIPGNRGHFRLLAVSELAVKSFTVHGIAYAGAQTDPHPLGPKHFPVQSGIVDGLQGGGQGQLGGTRDNPWSP